MYFLVNDPLETSMKAMAPHSCKMHRPTVEHHFSNCGALPLKQALMIIENISVSHRIKVHFSFPLRKIQLIWLNKKPNAQTIMKKINRINRH